MNLFGIDVTGDRGIGTDSDTEPTELELMLAVVVVPVAFWLVPVDFSPADALAFWIVPVDFSPADAYMIFLSKKKSVKN